MTKTLNRIILGEHLDEEVHIQNLETVTLYINKFYLWQSKMLQESQGQLLRDKFRNDELKGDNTSLENTQTCS